MSSMVHSVDYLEMTCRSSALPQHPLTTSAVRASPRSPRRPAGATDTAVWTVEILPGTPASPHSLTREEVFVVLQGTASVTIAGHHDQAAAGDAIIVPADAEFELANSGGGPLQLVCCFPVGGQARLADGSTFTPPWAQ